MTASPSTSQVAYKIENNRLVCYTPEENRVIAEIFLTEEYLYEAVIHLDHENNYMIKVNEELEKTIEGMSIVNKQYENLLKECIKHSESILEDNYGLKKENSFYKTILYISIGINIVTFGLILL